LIQIIPPLDRRTETSGACTTVAWRPPRRSMETRMKKPVTWLVIADGERARILARRADAGGWETISSVQSAHAHRTTAELGTDKPGRAQESVGAARHAVAPRSDLHARDKEEFAHTVAGILNEAAPSGEFDRLVLVALPHTLAALRDGLSREAAEKVGAELQKDLTKLPDHEIAADLTMLGDQPAGAPARSPRTSR
jgi:protein required for attachment to host cells